MKKILYILPLFLIVTLMPKQAHAAGFLSIVVDFIAGLFSNSPLEELSNNIIKLAELINQSTSEMMRFGDMLMCSGLHGSAADIDIVGVISLKLIAPSIYLSGALLYIIGFLIMLMTSFYLFDAAFNLSISVILLPLALALWPFGWTRDKLKIVINSILYYTGVFIFLPLGVLMAKELAFSVVEMAFKSSAGFDFQTAYEADQSDLIEENLGIFCMPFLKVLLFYVVALRIIPLMATEFCKYFFGNALVGSPMMDRITQAAKHLMRQGKKAGKLGKDISKHQMGKKIEGKGNDMSNPSNNIFSRAFGRVLSQYGKNMARTRRGR